MLQLRLTQLLNLVLLASLVAADVFDPHLAIQIARSDALPRATNHGPKDVSHTFQRDTVSQGAIKINNAGEAYSTVLVNGASAPPAAPMVALPDGSVLVGVASTTAAQEMFFGVRYAAPPTGALRFRNPQPPPSPAVGPPPRNASILNTSAPLNSSAPPLVDATLKGPICPQAATPEPQDEDCLFMNIQRPVLASNASLLPVLLFFHGGGFQGGSGNSIDPTALVAESIQTGQPVIVATINYRLGLFGFLASSELARLAGVDRAGHALQQSMSPTVVRDGSSDSTSDEQSEENNEFDLNLTFKDMQQSIRWLSENAAAFGGDPAKITIWGQSAGAFGVGAQLVGNPGKPTTFDALNSGTNGTSSSTRPLFRAAILQSGAPGGVPIANPSEKDAQFRRVLHSTRCAKADAGIHARLACLRALDWHTLNNANLAEQVRASNTQGMKYILGSYPWTATLDGGPDHGGLFADIPSKLLDRGDFANVPLLNGDCLDEGTIFAPQGLFNEDEFAHWFKTIYFIDPSSPEANAAYEEIMAYYPDDPAVGSPYNATEPESRIYGLDNMFKRAASIYGDIRFQSDRRLLLESNLGRNARKDGQAEPAFSFLFAQETGNAASGVPHGSDLPYVMDSKPGSVIGDYMKRAWIAFATSLNPNVPGQPSWPVYDNSAKQLIRFANNGTDLISDTYRQDAIDSLNRREVLVQTGR